MNTSNIAISVKSVSKYYRVFDRQGSRLLHTIWPAHKNGMQEIQALKDINFEIRRGEAVAIIGRNGSGKSTLLEILTGTLTPTTGTVRVEGRVSALLELGSGFNPEYSGRDNVILNGLLLGLSKNDLLNRMNEIESFAEIGTAIDRPVKTYSTGMMMRLAFSVQIICDPEILIIDEALSVGDFFFQQKCLNYILALCAKGVTLLFVSHDMSMVRRICQRAIYLDRGVKKFDGESKEAAWRYTNIHNVDKTHEQNTPARDTSKYRSLQSLWLNVGAGPGELYSVNITDCDGIPSTSFEIGEIAIFEIEFLPTAENPCDITIGILDRTGRLVTATGSIQLSNSPEKFLAPKYLHKYHVEMSMALEAGEYGVEVTLGYRTNVNQGVGLHKAPQIGPITINWDYEGKTAPFIGCVGLPCSGHFCEPLKLT